MIFEFVPHEVNLAIAAVLAAMLHYYGPNSSDRFARIAFSVMSFFAAGGVGYYACLITQ